MSDYSDDSHQMYLKNKDDDSDGNNSPKYDNPDSDSSYKKLAKAAMDELNDPNYEPYSPDSPRPDLLDDGIEEDVEILEEDDKPLEEVIDEEEVKEEVKDEEEVKDDGEELIDPDDGGMDTDFSVGLGFNYGSFNLDVDVSEGLFTNPVQHVTGYESIAPENATATLTYSW